AQVIFSQHPFFTPDVRVASLNADRRSYTPFPNEYWNKPHEDTDHYLDSVLGIRSDENGIVWMLDMGQRTGITPKLVGWNTNTNLLERIYYIPSPASLPESQHNDFAIDPKHGVFIIADEGIGPGGDGTTAALVTIDMATGKTRRLLQGHKSTLPENVKITVDGKDLAVTDEDGKKENLRIGADGIVADLNYEWLYFGPASGSWIYRIRLDDLVDETLSNGALETKVERYAQKPNNGGLSIDEAGNLYLTAIESTAVGVIPAATKKYAQYAANPELIWPDGVSYSPDEYMYVSAA
ncbi:MAG: L-dopachrome tautomerase-related protein, partial [Cyanobacteria bacterium J06649_4]